jgi:hypothetical protein
VATSAIRLVRLHECLRQTPQSGQKFKQQGSLAQSQHGAVPVDPYVSDLRPTCSARRLASGVRGGRPAPAPRISAGPSAPPCERRQRIPSGCCLSESVSRTAYAGSRLQRARRRPSSGRPRSSCTLQPRRDDALAGAPTLRTAQSTTRTLRAVHAPFSSFDGERFSDIDTGENCWSDALAGAEKAGSSAAAPASAVRGAGGANPGCDRGREWNVDLGLPVSPPTVFDPQDTDECPSERAKMAGAQPISGPARSAAHSLVSSLYRRIARGFSALIANRVEACGSARQNALLPHRRQFRGRAARFSCRLTNAIRRSHRTTRPGAVARTLTTPRLEPVGFSVKRPPIGSRHIGGRVFSVDVCDGFVFLLVEDDFLARLAGPPPRL